jgi:hypothetical protein
MEANQSGTLRLAAVDAAQVLSQAADKAALTLGAAAEAASKLVKPV